MGAVVMMLIPKAEEELHKVVALLTTLVVGVVGILLTDLSYALVDPRIRFE